MSTYIKKLIEKGEGQHLDFKFGINDSRKIARSLAAFANTEGGTLLIGVKDNGSIAGVRSEEEFYMVQAAATLYCRPPVEFLTHQWLIEGKTILEITVNPRPDDFVYAQDKDERWMVYIRVGDQNLVANQVFIQARKKRRNPSGIFLAYTVKEKLLLEYLNLHQHITLSKYCRLTGIGSRQASQILARFVALDIINQVVTEKGCYYTLKEGFDASCAADTHYPGEFLKF